MVMVPPPLTLNDAIRQAVEATIATACETGAVDDGYRDAVKQLWAVFYAALASPETAEGAEERFKARLAMARLAKAAALKAIAAK